jgi:nucleoside phosphorylase
MKVLITFALENEFSPWRGLRRFTRNSAGRSNGPFSCRIGSADVRVVLTGAGRFAAQSAMQHAFDDRPDVCIASGLSGALKPKYCPSDILVAQAVTDASRARLIPSDPGLLRSAEASGAMAVERFLVSDRVVSTADEKRSLGAIADAVDMESIFVLSAAAHHGIRSVAIRAISDGVESDLPLDFNRVFSRRGTVSIPRVIGQVAWRPHKIAGVLRLAHETERAAAALARFLDAFVQDLAAGPLPEIAKAEALAV